jgi:hypothetical protein
LHAAQKSERVSQSSPAFMQCWYSFFLARSSLTRSPRTSTAL